MMLLLLTGPGCLSFMHPITPNCKEEQAACAAFPPQCRNHVHVFFIHGLDPLDFANLSGVRDYVQSLGFIKTHYGQLYHIFQFKNDVRQIHREDPEARFVLVGFSFGANMVRELANSVEPDGIQIDLLIYLGGNTLENTPPNRPDHVARIVNILATGCIWNGTTLDRAENLHYSDVWHFGSPSHPKTLEILARELAVVASHVPIVQREEPLAPLEGPTPRPVLEQTKGPRDEWDFLKPTEGLDESHRPPHPVGDPELAPAPRKDER